MRHQPGNRRSAWQQGELHDRDERDQSHNRRCRTSPPPLVPHGEHVSAWQVICATHGTSSAPCGLSRSRCLFATKAQQQGPTPGQRRSSSPGDGDIHRGAMARSAVGIPHRDTAASLAGPLGQVRRPGGGCRARLGLSAASHQAQAAPMRGLLSVSCVRAWEPTSGCWPGAVSPGHLLGGVGGPTCVPVAEPSSANGQRCAQARCHDTKSG